MSEEELRKRILSYVNKHSEELQEKTGIEQFVDFLFEVYKTIPSNQNSSEKTNYILEQLKDEEDPVQN